VNRILLLLGLCALMIMIRVVDLMWGGAFDAWGIQPRQIGSLLDIFTAPFVHRDFAHLGNNLAVFVVLGGLCLIRGVRYFLLTSLLIIVLSGILLWVFGREGVHAGASGWIFGLWSLTMATAWFDRSLQNFAIAAGVALYYGGMIYGVLPVEAGVSFEGHFFGAVAGIVAAYALSRRQLVAAPAPPPVSGPKFWE
jgi:membrane associated rhomboid family serine protease